AQRRDLEALAKVSCEIAWPLPFRGRADVQEPLVAESGLVGAQMVGVSVDAKTEATMPLGRAHRIVEILQKVAQYFVLRPVNRIVPDEVEVHLDWASSARVDEPRLLYIAGCLR